MNSTGIKSNSPHLSSQHIVVIGGGAAGFFAAINIALQNPKLKVSILEKSNKLLAKVKVSGGGRCNVSHHCFDNNDLIKNYPRGSKELLQVFSRFNVQDTITWFKQQGVVLKTEEDGRIFPYSNESQTIIDCFLGLASKLQIRIRTNCEVFSIKKEKGDFLLKTNQELIMAHMVVCAQGGHPKSGAYDIIKNMGHTIVEPIPSLFTLNLPQSSIRKELQGLSVEHANVKLEGSKFNYSGPILITHWGLSGPAVLKLSAYAAKEFHERNYRAVINLNWVYPLTISEVESELKKIQKEKHRSLPHTNAAFKIPRRLWEFLCEAARISTVKPWAEVRNSDILSLAQVLTNSVYDMQGKTTFKEEFVTCGGVSLKEVDFKTMQSKIVPGLYFCGEVLNIDGITGGFNFQNAWSTAWVCAFAISD